MDGTTESVRVILFNEARPSIWEQVEDHLKREGSIGNTQVRRLLGSDDPVRASRLLKAWVNQGLLEVLNPDGPKRERRYGRVSFPEATLFAFSKLQDNDPG